MPKQRTSEQIRGAAITMGIKKAQSGCTTCAEGYFDLAKQHGATEEEIQAALEQATGASGKGLSRRDLIKIAVASGLALTTSGLLLPQTSRVARAATYYWGIDSNTTICCAMPLNFYIGRMGQGITADTTYFAFNTAMANQLGPNFVFGYWGVQGPVGRPSQYDPYGWGVAQGQAAWDAWSGNFIGAAYIGGYTVFGDIEEGFGGWTLHVLSFYWSSGELKVPPVDDTGWIAHRGATGTVYNSHVWIAWSEDSPSDLVDLGQYN